jgi:hypothetical protein
MKEDFTKPITKISLSPTTKRRIEENRLKAIEKLRESKLSLKPESMVLCASSTDVS